ncbi:MAG TPA: DUF2520 domain-containing protein [Gammaproteobacteria bacterium]|nr:DUF2520 domain-containing protein [Gammaproteobacteria bacterium]
MKPKYLNIIGAGQVGSVLGYLLTHKTQLRLNCVLNTSLASATQACHFIGQGKAITHFNELTPANYYIITAPDQKIRYCAEQLAITKILRPGDLVLHCSGALSSEVLEATQKQGAITASLHPIKSFVDPQLSIQTFAGTFCGLEGTPEACQIISDWVKQLDAEVLLITPEQKLIYHAAFVIGCNYLTALTETALRCLRHTQITEEQGLKALQPLMRLTLEQIFIKGTAGALTGPIARGDWEVVAKQSAALVHLDTEIASLYQSLGKIALGLARTRNPSNEQNFSQVEEILSNSTN